MVTFTDSGVLHSSGVSIDFIRDHRDRIKEIVSTPPATRSLYEYDLAGDLRSVTNAASLTTRYEYLSNPAHYLDAAYQFAGQPERSKPSTMPMGCLRESLTRMGIESTCGVTTWMPAGPR